MNIRDEWDEYIDRAGEWASKDSGRSRQTFAECGFHCDSANVKYCGQFNFSPLATKGRFEGLRFSGTSQTDHFGKTFSTSTQGDL
jgi:hypothetical protein